MFNPALLLPIGILGLSTGFTTKYFAKKHNQKILGQLGMTCCVAAAYIGGFIGGIGWIFSPVMAIAFIVVIQRKS